MRQELIALIGGICLLLLYKATMIWGQIIVDALSNFLNPIVDRVVDKVAINVITALESDEAREDRERKEAEEEKIKRDRARERINEYDAWQAKLEWEEEQKRKPKKPQVGPYANSASCPGSNSNPENDVYNR